MSSNRREGHEISLLALHFNQNCMIYINQFDYQNIISEATLARQNTLRNYAALTPLVWEHINPYERFDLDMNARLDLPEPRLRLVTRLLVLPPNRLRSNSRFKRVGWRVQCVVSWAHINILGVYDFSDEKFKDSVGNLPLKSAA